MTRTPLCLVVLESLTFRSYCNQVSSCCANDRLPICHLPSAIGDWATSLAHANAAAPLRPRQGASTLLEHSQAKVPSRARCNITATAAKRCSPN